MHQSAAGGIGLQITIGGMTSAETSAPSFDPSFAEPKGSSLRRWLAPFTVAIALLSTLLTFVVLTGLTRIEPTRVVVISFLLMNAAIILLLVGIISYEVWLLIQARRRGRAACDPAPSTARSCMRAFAAARTLPSVWCCAMAAGAAW